MQMIEHGYTRTLDQGELRSLARKLRAQPGLWSHLVPHEPGQRVFELLIHDEHVSAWVIAWDEDQDTGYHDHDLSYGAVAIARGQIREERLRVGARPIERIYVAGDIFGFTPGDIHRVTHAGNGPAVTLHVYSPRLERMGAYLIEDDGTLTRHSVEWDEELRPLGQPA
jgi:predicted metal-dependent enzyme (double-stranded beta helix superfamily)